MQSFKIIIGIITIILAVVAYVPYLRDIFKGKTKPSTFSFFTWGVSTLIIYSLQVDGGGGPGSWVTLWVGLICLFIFILSFKYGYKNITRVDVIFFISSLLALY